MPRPIIRPRIRRPVRIRPSGILRPRLGLGKPCIGAIAIIIAIGIFLFILFRLIT